MLMTVGFGARVKGVLAASHAGTDPTRKALSGGARRFCPTKRTHHCPHGSK